MRVLLILLALALLPIPAAAAAPDAVPASAAQSLSPSVAEGGCAAPFDLAAELGLQEPAVSGVELPGGSPEPEWLAPPWKKGYCHCGCGVTCTSSADCGGSPCRPFITCC